MPEGCTLFQLFESFVVSHGLPAGLGESSNKPGKVLLISSLLIVHNVHLMERKPASVPSVVTPSQREDEVENVEFCR